MLKLFVTWVLKASNRKKEHQQWGGVIIILGIVVPTLLFARLDTIYIILMLIATVWLGIIGFIDDYLKLRAKRMAHEQGVTYKKKEIKMDWQAGLKLWDK